MDEEDEIEDHSPPSPHHGFEHFVRHNPTAAVVGAPVVGIVLGRMGLL